MNTFILDPKDFEVENDHIGEGNFGSVSLVHPKNDKRKKIALKMIPVDLTDHDTQKSFIREISIMATLNHPSLIRLIGFTNYSKKHQSFQIYSEYLPNRTLIDALRDDECLEEKKKTLNPTRRSIIVYGIASAMSYLHKNKIVHRDLKPENIFLDAKYHPVLSDFGLSRFCSEQMKMTVRIGTPYFMAPEMFTNDEEKVTEKVDVYAFAVTLLSFFTTDYKFKGSQPTSINQLVGSILKGKRYKIPKYAPEYYEKLINRCWENDPQDRPSFDDILYEFNNDKEFILEGSKEQKVMDYVKMVNSYDTSIHPTDSNKLTSHSSNKSSSSYEDTKEFDFLQK